MSRPSKIAQLPPEALSFLNDLLRQSGMTRTRAHELLEEYLVDTLGLPEDEAPSRHSVNRYANRMEMVGARLRQSREVAEMWIGKLGNQPQGEIGKLINEVIRTLTFETSMQLAEGEEVVSPKILSQLALAVQRLESAANMNAERDKAIREEERRRIAEELDAATADHDAARTGGMTREGIATIKREILGIV